MDYQQPLVNGKNSTSLALTDRGLQYGDGIFETIAIIHQQPILWSLHYQRLKSSCDRLLIPVPDENLLKQEVKNLTADNDKCIIKIIITRGTGERGYRIPIQPKPTRILSRHPWPNYPAKNQQQGIDITVCQTPYSTNSALAGMKTLSRLPQILARTEIDQADVAEGLMLDEQKNIISASFSNIFLVSKQKVYTPKLTSAGVDGVMRQHLLSLLKQKNILFSIDFLNFERIMEADEVFCCNSVFGIWPVRQLCDHNAIIKQWPVGSTTKMLQNTITELGL